MCGQKTWVHRAGGNNGVQTKGSSGEGTVANTAVSIVEHLLYADTNNWCQHHINDISHG